MAGRNRQEAKDDNYRWIHEENLKALKNGSLGELDNPSDGILWSNDTATVRQPEKWHKFELITGDNEKK